MKKILNIIVSSLFVLAFASCSSDIEETWLSANPVAPVMGAVNSTVINDANANDVFTFKWTKADVGVKTQIDYTILVGYAGHFEEFYSGLNGDKYELKNSELATSLTTILNVPKGEDVELSFKVNATVGTTYKTLSSNVVTANFRID